MDALLIGSYWNRRRRRHDEIDGRKGGLLAVVVVDQPVSFDDAMESPSALIPYLLIFVSHLTTIYFLARTIPVANVDVLHSSTALATYAGVHLFYATLYVRLVVVNAWAPSADSVTAETFGCIGLVHAACFLIAGNYLDLGMATVDAIAAILSCLLSSRTRYSALV